MIVLVLTAVPAGLRGDLTKWLMEVNPGVFVGNPSARIRAQLWDRVRSECKDGRAVLVWSSDGEQRLRFDVHHHPWQPVDVEGLTLIRRPLPGRERGMQERTGWSRARAMRRARRPSWRGAYDDN